MDKIDIMNTVKLSSPHLFGLLVTQDDDSGLNVMGVSWFCFASLKPPMMLLCLSKKGYSGSVLEKTKKATLCLITEDIKQEALQCCRCSGRDTDKFEEFGINTVSIDGFSVPAVEESRIAWALELSDTMDAGDHIVYLTEIKDAAQLSEKDALYAFEGYRELRTILR